METEERKNVPNDVNEHVRLNDETDMRRENARVHHTSDSHHRSHSHHHVRRRRRSWIKRIFYKRAKSTNGKRLGVKLSAEKVAAVSLLLVVCCGILLCRGKKNN